MQRMMLSVLKSRLAAENAAQSDAEEADRGSEMGCLDEFILDVDDGVAL